MVSHSNFFYTVRLLWYQEQSNLMNVRKKYAYCIVFFFFLGLSHYIFSCFIHFIILYKFTFF